MAESINPKEDDDGETPISVRGVETALPNSISSRKVKRKVAKKEKRKQIRKELAEKARAEEEARLNDPEEQRRIQLEEEREKERLERERREFEEREKLFLEELARKQAEEEEAEESRKALEEELKRNHGSEDNELNEDDEWEYVEEGPPEIIWQGNEIIVKKNRVKVKKKDANQLTEIEDPNRPTSNPLPPQSEAYNDFKDASKPSAQQLLENVAQQVSNFGTEQDKAHCPFHIKTGACRFGSRCNRAHFYPDKSCTLLIKNMYTGPGLVWEQDEGLERVTLKLHSGSPQFWPVFVGDLKAFADNEEVESCYEEFYEDVHTEFLKFGEIVNFKVCRNGSFHLRGNVYIHYKSLDSAVMAYHAVNGRYFAGKQVTCEFVSVTKWKVAICGEYMKSRLKTCSRGTACNFLHCFGNPGGDYEWADWDRPPPRYWVKKMTALFGYLDEYLYEKDQQMEQESPRERCNSIRISDNRYRSTRSRSREGDLTGRYARSPYNKHDEKYRKTHTHDGRKRRKSVDEKYHRERNYEKPQHDKNLSSESDSDRSRPDWDVTQSRDIDRDHSGSRKRSKSNHVKEVLVLFDDYGKPRHPKLEEKRVKKRRHSSRSDHLGLEGSKLSSSEEHIKSSNHLETGNFNRFRSRTRTSSIDPRDIYDEDVEEMRHRESDNDQFPDKHKRSKRKSTYEHYPNEDEERWKPEGSSSPKKDNHKSRRQVDNERGETAGGRSRRSRWSSRERDVRVVG